MIIQTASPGTPRLAVMMHEHTALCAQFARAFGNDRFESLSPLDLMIYVIGHHDAGWTEFDRNPVTDEKTGLPYNLVETPAEHITVTSRLSPDFNERQHPYCGLISSMHSWGLYNGRYGLSNLVLIDRIPQHDRPLMANMVEGGRTPLADRKTLEEVGYSIAIFPGLGFLAAGAAMHKVYSYLKEHGSSVGGDTPLYKFAEFSDLMGFREVTEFDKTYRR
jgi:hypothetical protein